MKRCHIGSESSCGTRPIFWNSSRSSLTLAMAFWYSLWEEACCLVISSIWLMIPNFLCLLSTNDASKRFKKACRLSWISLVIALNCSHSFSRYSFSTGPVSSFQILCKSWSSRKAFCTSASASSAWAFSMSLFFFSKFCLKSFSW